MKVVVGPFSGVNLKPAVKRKRKTREARLLAMKQAARQQAGAQPSPVEAPNGTSEPEVGTTQLAGPVTEQQV